MMLRYENGKIGRQLEHTIKRECPPTIKQFSDTDLVSITIVVSPIILPHTTQKNIN